MTDRDGLEVARCLINYSSKDIKKILGKSSREFRKVLGYIGPDEVASRENISCVMSKDSGSEYTSSAGDSPAGSRPPSRPASSMALQEMDITQSLYVNKMLESLISPEGAPLGTDLQEVSGNMNAPSVLQVSMLANTLAQVTPSYIQPYNHTYNHTYNPYTHTYYHAYNQT